MSRLELPHQLQGPWDHALILTYGLDAIFFEQALWGQFAARCRNKIILADGQRYLEACASYAQTIWPRHLNQRYVAEGIYAPCTAHAKLILLTNPEQGRLLVGSGNLNMQGYASGGELFTRYEYSSDSPETLNNFVAVRELIEYILRRRYVSATAARHIEHLFAVTGWLFQSFNQGWQAVRHNLEYSFLDHILQAVGDEPVEELHILSPFYDQNAIAFQHLVNMTSPQRTYVLIQPGRTSVDSGALQRQLDRLGDLCELQSFSKPENNPYVHAKFYLVKMRDRAICLQGSPNLSQAAMLLTVPQGNIELANLLVGPRDTFDELLTALNTQRVWQPGTLHLSYQPVGESYNHPASGWRLVSGEWYHDRLYLNFQGDLPELRDVCLAIGDREFTFVLRNRESNQIELTISPEMVQLLQRPVPVTLRWCDGDRREDSNPVFVCNRSSLAYELQADHEASKLDRVGDLGLDDAELEGLLMELDAALTIDRRSIWLLAGKPLPAAHDDEDDESLRLNYADVDYDVLRQHPKIQQYLISSSSNSRYGYSRLQVILKSITNHFNGLLDLSRNVKLVSQTTASLRDTVEFDEESEEERDQEQAEKEIRTRSRTQRLNRILKNFIHRYLRGIQTKDFQDAAGFEVVVQNYVIFTHILWRLFSKDWVEPEFIIGSLIKTWAFFWGDGRQTGCFWMLDDQQRSQVIQFVHGDQRSAAVLFASLYYGARLSRFERWDEERFALRDFWQHFSRNPPFGISKSTFEDAWRISSHMTAYEPPPPTDIVEELKLLEGFQTRDSFLWRLKEKRLCVTGNCYFDQVSVMRKPLERLDTVHCLVLRSPEALVDMRQAIDILREWMAFENLDYYRLSAPDTGRVLFYDILENSGRYWAKDKGEEAIDLGPIDWSSTSSDGIISDLRYIAAQLAISQPDHDWLRDSL